MARPVQPGAFDIDLSALQTLRRRLTATPMRKSKRDKLLMACDLLHDQLREIVEAPVEKRV